MLIQTELQGVIQPDLESGETLIWAGKPNPGRMVTSTIPLFLFGVVWTVHSVAFTWNWPRGTGTSGIWGMNGIPFYLFMAPFIAVGVGMLSLPARTYLRGQKTYYAITNKRVLIIEPGKSRKVQSYAQREIGNLQRQERQDGSGDLIFAQESYKDSDGDSRTRDIRFVGIPEVRTVENILREVFHK